MKWRKLGRVFCPDHNHPWMISHAANPLALPLGGDRVRVLFSCRDDQQRSSVGWVEVDLARPDRVLELSPEPVLLPGAPGEFDDSGTTVGCAVPRDGGGWRLYYLGWNLCRPTPWRNSIGLAYLDEHCGPARRHAPAPVLDRSAEDPQTLSYPWVLREGPRWRMWYGSNLSWGDDPPASVVHVLKHAESDDGLHWRRDGRPVLGSEPGPERAFVRPCVVRDADGGYRMWYSYRGPRYYRIGHAVSADGLSWERRDDEVGIGRSDATSDWDGEMVAYAHVFDHGGSRYMLYCGNGYGRTGFGLAVLERD